GDPGHRGGNPVGGAGPHRWLLPDPPRCTWTPTTTPSPAGKRRPPAGCRVRSPRVGPSAASRGPPLDDRADPCLGQPGRQAALVHRAPPAGSGVLAGAGQRRHRAWPVTATRLDPLPLAGATTAP